MKKIKITVNKALQSIQGLKSLNESGKLPMHISLLIAHNARELNLIGDVFEEKRRDLLTEFGEVDEETGATTIPKENIEKFNKLAKAITDEEVEVSIKKIAASKFPEGYEIEPLALVDLEWMITEE